MPHSSSGFGEIKVNRVYLVETETAKEGTDGTLGLEGQESAPPTTVAMVTWLHGQISGMQEGRVIPVTFRDKAERNGYYSVSSASSELTDYQNEVAAAAWSLDLQRIGGENEIDLQSRLTGAVRQNDFALTGTRWHSPAIGHYAYLTGTTLPSNHDRVTEDGTIRVYTGVPANTSPRWGCNPTDYLKGAVRLTDTTYVDSENQVEGINRTIGATGWTLSNGLIQVSPTSTDGRLRVGLYSNGSYKTTDWDIRSGDNNLFAWKSATLLRNDPEQVVLRLTVERSGSTGGRETLDLTLRRGAQFVEGYLQVSESNTLRIWGANASVSATASNGTVGATANNADGIRQVAGTSRTYGTPNLTNGGFASNGSVTYMDFWLGATIGAGTASETDSAALQNQYIASLPEATYAVRR
jgi:hypothetical protein